MLATREDFTELVKIMFNNSIVPLVDSVFKLKDLKEAQEKFVSKDFIGKIVLNCKK